MRIQRIKILKFQRVQVLKDSVTPACVGKQSREILHCTENLTLIAVVEMWGHFLYCRMIRRINSLLSHSSKTQAYLSKLQTGPAKKISKHGCANKASLLWLENLFHLLTRPVSRCPNYMYIVIGNIVIPTENKTLLCHM